MIASTRHRRRSLPILLAGVGLLTATSACADRGSGEAAAPSSGASSAASPAAPSPAAEEAELSTEDELAAGLLPPEAFGPDAQVVTVDVRQLSTSGSGGLPPGGTVTPPECGQSVGSTQLTPEDFGVVVAQTATTGTGVTAQVLAESEQVDGEEPQFDEVVARCPEVTVELPDGSRATITFTDFEVPDVGDTSDGVAFTTAVQGADGTSVTVPTLIAVAAEGQRLLFLQQTGASSAPLDEAAFTALFEDAFEAQQQA
ncbi:hypothetical protein ACI79C_04145 [Geodermatophilus sp. SYSU D00697]